MSDFKYPSQWQSCRLGWSEVKDRWDVCCSCRHFDECEFKETFRVYSPVVFWLIILSSILVSAVVAYLTGVL